MKIDFDNPPLADKSFTYTPDQLKGVCTKHKGEWVCTAYVETETKIVLCAISYGKKMKPTLKQTMKNAIDRSNKVTV